MTVKRPARNASPVVRRRGRPSKSGEATGGTQSVERALSLLLALAEGMPGVGHRSSHLAAKLGLGPATSYRLLKTLASQGFVAQDPVSDMWYLGPVVYELGLAATPNTALMVAAEPMLNTLAHETGNSAVLIVRSGAEAACIHRVDGNSPIRTFTVEVGTRRPLGVGVSGIAILAALDATEAETIIVGNSRRFKHYNGLSADRVRTLVSEARGRGYAVDFGEFYPEVGGISTVVQTGARGLATLGLITTVGRLGEAELRRTAKILRAQATLLKNKLMAAPAGAEAS